MSTLYKELGYLARRQLAVILNHESVRGVDWKGLADKMCFSYEVIVALRGSASPTLALLEEWEKAAGADANIDNLISLLESLGCAEGVEVVKGEKERRVNHIDILGNSLSEYPLTPCSSLDPASLDLDEIQRIRQVQVVPTLDPDRLAEGLANISMNTSRGSPQLSASEGRERGDTLESLESLRKHKFDIFLSFAEEDERFAEEVRVRLVENAGAKVFVPSSGLMSDRAFHEEIADMIKEGCIRTIIILSPDYLSSPWCGFEANLAFTNSPAAQKNRTIPILYKECEVPAFLRHLHYLDYPRFSGNRKDCEDYFWARLYKSIAHKV